MSLARLALRLASIEALRPTAALTSGVYPTLAGKLVFDSRIDPIEDLKVDEAQPVICVYTEHDDGQAGQKRGGPPFLLTVDLVFELSVVVKVASEGDPTQFVVAEPETDAELEASIDILEAQIKFVLMYGPTGEIWRGISHRKVHNPRSAPHRTSEEGARLARRTLTWKVEVQDDCFDPAPASAPTGFDAFPEPLRSLAAILPANSYALKILNGLAAEPTLPVMPTAIPLDTVSSGVAVANPTTGALPAQPQITAVIDGLQD